MAREPLHLDLKKGALRRTLGTKKGKKIPVEKLEEAKHSENPKTRKRANLALVMRKWNHHHNSVR